MTRKPTSPRAGRVAAKLAVERKPLLRNVDRTALAACEVHVLSMVTVLALAERRMAEPELRKLEASLAAIPDDAFPDCGLSFLAQFSGQIAVVTRNALLDHQSWWWVSGMQDLGKRSGADIAAIYRRLPKSFYSELLGALRRGYGAPQHWMSVVVEVLDWTEAQRDHAMHDTEPASVRVRVYEFE